MSPVSNPPLGLLPVGFGSSISKRMNALSPSAVTSRPHRLYLQVLIAIVLGAASDGKVALIAGVTADLTGKVKAGELVNFVAQQVGGKGGGKPDMAMAGGSDAAALPKALASVAGWVGERA